MSEKYSYSDVIIDPCDPRIEFGEGYYHSDIPKRVLIHANNDNDNFLGSLEEISNDTEFPFVVRKGSSLSHWTCLIRKKEPRKTYVPFDLTKEEDRAKLRGAWVRISDYPNIEYQITSMNAAYVFCDAQKEGIRPGLLSTSYEFVDGSPCGRLVEEE